jgi:hypothetical protein
LYRAERETFGGLSSYSVVQSRLPRHAIRAVERAPFYE